LTDAAPKQFTAVRWPEVAPNAEQYVREALYSGRWAITSMNNGANLYERKFAKAFAAYLGASSCVPTDHGSSALVIALEALGAEHGGEVIVPALTWVATATAVFRAGLVPVIADVDPESGCVTPTTIEDSITPRTVAIIAVHWACVMANMPEILRIAQRHSLAVIEDAAQAHGAAWQGKRAGTFGAFGCFSMHHAKVLTCGEGGAVVTDNTDAVQRLEELRADSRSYRVTPAMGQLELRESASIMGANFAMAELNAALLCAQLELLPEQQQRRNNNYELFTRLIESSGVSLLRRDARQDELSVYEAPIKFPVGAWSTERIAAELTTRLGVHVYLPREPLARSCLLQPATKSTLGPLAQHFAHRNAGRIFPGAEHIATRSVMLHHSAFLGAPDDVQIIATEVAAVAALARKG
jgi:L-glutamine:2-deoxy-scyllo-inosose/3-amino-2,3-dideoxy-scyllo-inosose aminotransferase